MTNDTSATSRTFTRCFMGVLLFGLAVTAVLAVVVDPLHQFGTGRVRSILTGERDEKPALFLKTLPRATALVLGSSKVMKLAPACVTELTGFPAFNFGLSDSLVEDWVAAYDFARANSPKLDELVIGVDAEAFDPHAEVDARLTSSKLLAPYVPGQPTRSLVSTVRALFGWQGFRYALLSLRYTLQPSARPLENYTFHSDGYLTYRVWEPELAGGTLPSTTLIADMERRLKSSLARPTFTALDSRRVQLFIALVRDAHANGIRIDAAIPPITPSLARIVDAGTVGQRLQDLDRLLRSLDAQGVLHYAPMATVADFGGDPHGFFDGIHMTPPNTNRFLLALFHRTRGCGVN